MSRCTSRREWRRTPAGNPNAVSNTLTYEYDTVHPTSTLSLDRQSCLCVCATSDLLQWDTGEGFFHAGVLCFEPRGL